MALVKTKLFQVWNFINRRKKYFIPLLLLILLLVYFLRPKTPPQTDTEKISRGDITLSVTGSGKITAENNVNLSFLSGGKVTYLGVKEGDSVSAYQTIAALDTRSLQKSLENSLRDYSRQRNSFEQTKQNNNNSTPTTAANEQVRRILENNQYDLDKAVISVELQDLAKQNSYLVSPISGIVIHSDIKSVGVNASPTQVISIADPNTLSFDIEIDEADIGKVSLDDPVEVVLDAYPETKLELQIKNIDYASHTTGTGSTVYTVHAIFPSDTTGKYRLGMGGDADIILQRKTYITKIPLSALIDNRYVYVKKVDKYEKRAVATGLRNDIDVEIKNGLNLGEVIAVQPEQISGNK